MFVELGTDSRTPIEAMPGIDRLSINHAVEEAGAVAALGVPAVLLFGIPAQKDVQASGAYDDEGVVQLAARHLGGAHRALRELRRVPVREHPPHSLCGRSRGRAQV